MPDRNASIILSLKADQLLAQSGSAARSMNVLTKEEQNAERQTVALARSMATLDAKLGAPAAGAARLRAALQNAAYIDDRQAVGALNQIISLEQKAEAEAARLGKGGGQQVLPRTLDGLTGSAAQVAKGFLTLQAIEKGFQFIKTGAEVADVTTSFNNLSRAAGTTGAVLLGSLRAASNNTITDASLIKSANLGLLLTEGRIAKDLPALTTIALASAKATGQSVDFVFESLVKGIARGSAKIIDNAGITLDGAKANEEYAASIGKSANQLTKAEQQQAVLNAVVKEGNQIVKDAGINAEDASVKIAAAQTAVQNLLTALATKAAPVAGSIAGGITELINTGSVTAGANQAGGELQANLTQKATSFEDYTARLNDANTQAAAAAQQVADRFANGNPAFALLIRSYFESTTALKPLTEAEFTYAQALDVRGVSAQVAYQQTQAQSGVLGELTGVINAASTGDDALHNRLVALVPAFAETSTGIGNQKQAVLDLISARGQGLATDDEVIQKLRELEIAHNAAAQAAFQEERENRNLARSFDGIVPAANAAAAAIAGVGGANPHQLPHLTDRHGPAGLVAGLLGDPKNIDAGIKAADQLAGVLFDNQLKRATTNAAKIALLRQKEAGTTDLVERAKIEGQIIDLQNQHNTGLSKTLSLNESIYDSINKQKQAQLDIEELTIKGRQEDRDAAVKDRTAQRLINALGGRTDARAQDFRGRAEDVIALDDVEKRKRAFELDQKRATAGGSIVNGRVLQSRPGDGSTPTQVGPQTPVGAGLPSAPAPAAGSTTATINLVVDGKVLASVSEPYIMDALLKAIRGANAGRGL